MVRVCLSLFVVVVATACSGIKNYELGFKGSAGLNPNEDNQPNPVQIRVLRLKGDEAAKLFGSTAFDQLWSKPAAVTGLALDGEVKSVIVPAADGRVAVALKEVGPSVTHVGILGLFNKPEPGKERLLLTKDQLGDGDILLRGGSITLPAASGEAAAQPRQN